jgi:hypothetical protein
MKTFFLALCSTLSLCASAEIKQIQIRVLGETPIPVGVQFRESVGGANGPRNGFMLTNQSSNMVPVKNRRILGFRMPFIFGQAHEVLLVGPYLNMCGEISILSEDNEVLATIRQAAFGERGKNNFYIRRDDEFRDEGFVRFTITEAIMDRIGRHSFKIKVGPIADLDIVECKMVNRYTAEAILVSGNGDTREQNGRHIRTTIPIGTDFTVTMKIRGGSAGEQFQFNNGSDLNFIYLRSECEDCDKNYIQGRGSIRPARLLAENDAIEFSVRAFVSGSITRQNGELLAIADAGAGNWSAYTPEKRGAFAIGHGPSKADRGEGWGPYLFMREATDIYRFGQYTDLFEIVTGDGSRCSCIRGGGGGGGTTRPIGGGGAGGGNVVIEPLSIEIRNAFTFSAGASPTAVDNFGSTPNICLTATDPNPKITTVAPLTAVLRSGAPLNNLTVRFRRGTNTLATTANVNVAAGAAREVVFTRPESRVCATRSLQNAAVCKRCGDGVQGVALWDDEGIVVEVLQGVNVLLTARVPEQ